MADWSTMTAEQKSRAMQRNRAWKQRNPERVATWSKENAPRARERKLRDRYGCSPEMYNAFNYAQGGLCFVCGEPNYGVKLILSVDHNHETNKFRGLLCTPCNQAEGMLRGNAAHLIRYLDMAEKRNELYG